jgi:hypothetical protein
MKIYGGVDVQIHVPIGQEAEEAPEPEKNLAPICTRASATQPIASCYINCAMAVHQRICFFLLHIF